MISIIIPVYNVEDYLRACINSALKQSFDDIEIIIIDDGSTDSTGAIIDEYAFSDSRIKVIHKKNEGVSIARKRGLEQANGKYILYLDGDDYLEPDAIERLYNRASETEADWVVGDYYICYPDGRRLVHRFIDFGVVDNVGFLNYCYSNPDFYFTGRLIRRDFLLSAKSVIPPEITYGEDNLAVTQYANQVRVAAKADAFVLNYVQRSSSVTNNKNMHDLQMRARAIRSCYEYIKSLPYYNQVRSSSDNYFVRELCSFISRGYYDDNLSFILTDCKYTGKRSFKILFIYNIAKYSPRLAIMLKKAIMKMVNRLKN